MAKKFTLIGLVLAYIAFAFYIALSVGILEIPDAFSYYNSANFLVFKRYFSVFPLNVSIPEVSHPPIYGLFVLFTTLHTHWGMTLLSFIQLVLVGLSGYLVYLSANIVSKRLGTIAVVLFFLLPFLFTYAVVMMSEVFTIFLVSLYLYLFLGIVTKRIHMHASFLIFLTCIMTLTKFVFICFVPVSFTVALYIEFRKKKRTTILYTLFRWIPAALGVACILWWMGFVHSYYGQYALTVLNGRRLYDGVIWNAKMLPPEESSAFKNFVYWTGLKNIPDSTWLKSEYYFEKPFNENKLTEVQIDAIYGDLAIAAIKENPLKFFFIIFQNTYRNFVSHPFSDCLLTDLGITEFTCWRESQYDCRIPWFCRLKGCLSEEINGMCRPLVQNNSMESLWARMIVFYHGYYPYSMIILLILTCFGGLMTIVRKSITGLYITAHTAFVLVGQAAVAVTDEGRYTMIAYPFIALLAAYGVHAIVLYIKRIIRT